MWRCEGLKCNQSFLNGKLFESNDLFNALIGCNYESNDIVLDSSMSTSSAATIICVFMQCYLVLVFDVRYVACVFMC